MPLSGIIDDDVIPASAGLAVTVSGSAPAENLEAEVKFFVADLPAVRERLLERGAIRALERVHEKNVRFDTPDQALLGRMQLLRLRRDSRVRLTFKGPAAQDAASEVKIREELEVEVSSFDDAAQILMRLGFVPLQTYEKYRETFHWRDVEVVLDETPFGDFVELEGAETAIRAAAAALGLDWERRILANYLALMELARRTFDLPFADLTFDNFARRPVDMGSLLPVCVLLDVDE